ncbi:hypothetical protein [Paenibacillus luteus]|nr:hypothetical protein [Paenibacillus luteus]
MKKYGTIQLILELNTGFILKKKVVESITYFKAIALIYFMMEMT